jgi:hypothetical protein
MFGRLVAAARRCVAALGRIPSLVLCVAGLATAVMYCANDNLDPKLGHPQDDGRYRPAIARGDGHMHFLMTRSIVFDRDFDFDDDLARFGDPWVQPSTVTGKKNVMQQIGPSLVWAPLLAIAHGAATVANLFGADIETHGYTMFHQRILFASSVVFGLLAIGLGVLVAYRLVGGRWGPTFAGVATLLGTSLTYYATFMPSYAHAMEAAACAGFLALWIRTSGDLRWRRYIGLGIALGIVTLIRPQGIGFGVVLAVELAVIASRRLRAAEPARVRALAAIAVLGRGALVLLIASIMFTPQLYVWRQMYGEWLTTPQGPQYMRYGHPMVLELLFSARNGWFSTHPIAYLGAIGLLVGTLSGPRLGRHVRLVCGALLVVIALQVYVNAACYEWWGAASFGQRRMSSVTLPLVVGLATLLRWVHLRIGARLHAGAKLAIATIVLGYLIAWNLAWLSRLTHGATAGRDHQPTCCDVPAPLSWIARPIYDVVGNPFQVPASAWFAAKHGVELRRWDAVVGKYAFAPPFLSDFRESTAVFDAVDDRYIVDGFSEVQGESGRPWRWTTAGSATLLVPILVPEPHRITMSIAANVALGEQLFLQIGCNGKLVASGFVGAEWTSITFETDGSLGENEIMIVAPVRPYRGGRALPSRFALPEPASGEPVLGVAIGPLRVALP